MKLSVVILCWNDRRVIGDCLRSIYKETKELDIEVIVSDNGSTDGSVEYIEQHYPATIVIKNKENLGFARGNNEGIKHSCGKYVLILNPDTIIHNRTLEKWIAFADHHPEAGAFGCRVLNADGSFQQSARPFPTVRRSWIAALYLRPLAYLSDLFIADTYTGWNGMSEKVIDWQSGCCVMFRSELLKQLGGFDGQFFYHFEEVDLCRRVWNAGFCILYTPDALITHLGGQSVNRFPMRFALEKYRNRYRYFYKHFGPEAARDCRRTILAWIWLREIGWRMSGLFGKSDVLKARLEMYGVTKDWNRRVDPVALIECGDEPECIATSR